MSTVANESTGRHRVISEIRPEMLNADLRKSESRDLWREIGECMDFARRYVGWTLEQLAAELPPPPNAEKRDPRQVRRWLEGEERPQLDVFWAVAVLQAPLTTALADRAKGLEMFSRIRRSA